MSSPSNLASEHIDPEALARLGFVAVRDPIWSSDFWSVQPCGVPEKDVDTGCAMADATFRAARDAGSYVLIAAVLRDIVQRGCFGDIEAGFIARLGHRAYVGGFQ